MNFDLLIDGKDVHAFLYLDAVPYEVVCGTNCTFEVEQELIGATTPDSGKFREFRKRLLTFVMTITGATTSDNDSNVSIFEFLDDESTSDPLDMSIVYTNHAGTQRTIRANWYLERANITGPADASSEFELILRGSGSYTHGALEDPVAGVEVSNIDSGTFVQAGGVIQDASLIGVTIIGVWQEGTNMESAGISYVYVSGTGTITPDPLVSFDGQSLFVIWGF
jgi:hypothetical protein